MSEADESTVERRKSRRHRALLSGRIDLNDGAATMDCRVHDLSQGGALLLVTDGARLPECFTLRIEHMKQPFAARIVWRDAGWLGVAFDPPPIA